MPTLTMNPEPIPGFDAVAESRKWRIATGQRLNAMRPKERLAYLHRSREEYLAARNAEAVATTSGHGLHQKT